MDLPAAGYLVIALFVSCWVGCVISWGFAAYYMVKTITRFHPERQWGRYIPVSLFMPWFFTSEGNFYRAKLLRAVGLFLLFFAVGAAIGLGAGGVAESMSG